MKKERSILKEERTRNKKKKISFPRGNLKIHIRFNPMFNIRQVNFLLTDNKLKIQKSH